MLPGPLVALDAQKTRALTTIYAPRKLKTRKHKTAQSRMLENNIPIKSTLSPFHPLPAIGQKKEKTKVIVFDLKKDDNALKLQEVLKPLTPLSIHALRKSTDYDNRKPHPLLRENTYDVIEPIYLNADKLKNTRRTVSENGTAPKLSPKTRFKNAALQVAKLTSLPETGKLLCLRERETYNIICRDNDSCRLQKLPQSPAQKLNTLSEIFQNLEMKGRHRDRMKKENSWF
ncbi:uncharacterized protein LOC126770235 [Nymphalis io]|uniref:uncharacterized protein LOC126770235 n=1 Tax=Inachis io TaxID=171585 RepID=UPI00216A2A24|nr:uncharacterized protein LOC126770235 [Nymphalis io]